MRGDGSVHGDVGDTSYVNNQVAGAAGPTLVRMPAAANRHSNVVGASEGQAFDDVGGSGNARHRRRSNRVEALVEQDACRDVRVIVGQRQGSAERRLERIPVKFRHRQTVGDDR